MMKVSTIIPAYNAERTIARTIDSALSQDCDGHEVVVVNDGSVDSTAMILNSYGNHIHVVTQPNCGASAARNAGVAESTGRYLAFLDSDDVWLPGKLETMVSALERNPLASLAFSDYGLIDSNGAACGESTFGDALALERLMSERPFPACSLPSWILPSIWVTPRQVFDRIGGFCEEFKGAGLEDVWILLLLRECGEFLYIPKKLAVYRLGRSNRNADKYAFGLLTFIALVRKRYGENGKALIREAKNRHCRSILSKIAHQMNNGDRWGVCCSVARIFGIHPIYFVSSEFASRLCLPQNTKRLLELIVGPASRTQKLGNDITNFDSGRTD